MGIMEDLEIIPMEVLGLLLMPRKEPPKKMQRGQVKSEDSLPALSLGK